MAFSRQGKVLRQAGLKKEFRAGAFHVEENSEVCNSIRRTERHTTERKDPFDYNINTDGFDDFYNEEDSQDEEFVSAEEWNKDGHVGFPYSGNVRTHDIGLWKNDDVCENCGMSMRHAHQHTDPFNLFNGQFEMGNIDLGFNNLGNDGMKSIADEQWVPAEEWDMDGDIGILRPEKVLPQANLNEDFGLGECTELSWKEDDPYVCKNCGMSMRHRMERNLFDDRFEIGDVDLGFDEIGVKIENSRDDVFTPAEEWYMDGDISFSIPENVLPQADLKEDFGEGMFIPLGHHHTDSSSLFDGRYEMSDIHLGFNNVKRGGIFDIREKDSQEEVFVPAEEWDMDADVGILRPEQVLPQANLNEDFGVGECGEW